MSAFFEHLFSADGFMPHGHCYLWRPGVLWLHILSDAFIALAYFSIPFTLVYFVRKRKDLEFDWMFICWYFHHFTGANPFGFSSQNLGSLYKGIEKDTSKNFKHLRKTKHTHNPVDDAKGNAEALLTMKKEHGLKIKF